MAKKVFYNRRYKMPGWAQPYAVWAVIAVVTLAIVAFTSLERVANEVPTSLPTRANGFADGLFYELRDGESGTQAEVIAAYASRLKRKYAYTVRESKAGGCHVFQIDRGKGKAYGIAAIINGDRSEAAYAAMVFLEKLAAHDQASIVSATILVSQKNCDKNEWIERWTENNLVLPVILDMPDGSGNATDFNRIGSLKNLALRRFFPAAFLTVDRATWANATGLISHSSSPILRLSIHHKFGSGPETSVAENPLLRHPAVSKVDPDSIAKPVALYLSANTQLYPGGFSAVLILVWLLALLPLVNALGTFRERIDLGPAATSFVLYAVAFLSYLLLFKLSLQFIKADIAIAGIAIILVPLIFFPLRVLQKTMLRAELNRAGLHLLVQAALSIVCFLNPLTALFGLLLLLGVSAFSRASVSRKLFRLVAIGFIATIFVTMTREALGNFAIFLSQYLPSFDAPSVVSLLLLCLVGGNLIALLFVPRERI